MDDFNSFIESTLETSDFEVLPLAGDASTRRYFRIVSGEETYVIMVWEPFQDNGKYPFLSVLDHFSDCDVKVPKVFAKCPRSGFILLEDLGDLTLERKFWENQDQQIVLPFYRKAIDELIKIHYSATSRQSSATCFQIEFDTEKFVWELNYGKEHLLVRLSQIDLTQNEIEALQEIFLDVSERLHRQAKYIAHRDYHSRKCHAQARSGSHY